MKVFSKLGIFRKIAQNISTDKFSKIRKSVYFAFAFLALISVFITLFLPLLSIPVNGVEYNVTAAGAIGASDFDEDTEIVQKCVFAVILIAMLVSVCFIMSALFSIKKETELVKRVQRAIILDTVFVAVFTIFCFIISPVNVMLGGDSKSNVSFASLIIVAITDVLYALFIGITKYSVADLDAQKATEDERHKKIKKLRGKLLYVRIELFVYALINAVVAMIALLSNIITVEFESAYLSMEKISLKGLELLKTVGDIEDMGRQLLAFMIFTALVIIAVSLFLSVVSFFSGSKAFGKISVISLSISTAVSLLVGLFSKYYDIVQDLNKGIIVSMIEDYVSTADVLEWTVSSAALYYFAFSLVVVAIVFIRHPYTKAILAEEQIEKESAPVISLAATPSSPVRALTEERKEDGNSEQSPAQLTNFDPCPAFTVLDRKRPEYKRQLDEKRMALLEEPTLPRLVEFIVQYARDSRLHLFYTQESIATFIAGLGTTKLTILQGMSGTGKTSLPKIVSEALMSVCDIVEVESSWRDKNELLGYYNEFSKTYTPKKFTQSLYKAALNPDILTFIVLDEMNLSRIEYYFSDFLSIMENEPDKREIKLLNVPLFRREEKFEYEYGALTDGFTLKIPNNVWFIGTANRDESTYDISDKVYDRAHTMNFDKRAASARHYGEPRSPKYLSVSALQKMFDEAKTDIDFSLEQYPIIAEVEKLLAPYNISFGNRIALQIENFVKIYASCFAVNDTVINDALEIILLSKVVRKLELKTIEDQESLADAFARLKLLRCSEFINGLKES